jgi:exopolysaccharide biosynthesis polyprenyl glycosylphosphotransferase
MPVVPKQRGPVPRTRLEVVRDIVAPARLPDTEPWRATYARILLIGDLALLLSTTAVAHTLRFGLEVEAPGASVWEIPHLALGILIASLWCLSMAIFGTRSKRVLGHGIEEYRRVLRASFAAFGAVAMVSLLFNLDASRGYLAFAFPIGSLTLLIWRKALRSVLHRRREQGHAIANVVVVGGVESALEIATFLNENPACGYRVTGVRTPRIEHPDSLRLDEGSLPIPVWGAVAPLSRVLDEAAAEAVIVSDTEHLGPNGLRELTWELDQRNTALLVAPSVLNVASSRLLMHDVSGMALLHVDKPQYAGANRFLKSAFDRAGALLMLLALSPLLITLAIAVKLSSDGPVFYRQQRVGRNGKRFRMIKFRSMRVGADAQLAALLAAEGKSIAELPKLTHDPRVTSVGAFIRRFSLDELPQLFNVLTGDMSLVGPRPQRDFEVARYDHVATRRLNVRPGMTGLWQGSGRSNLDVAEAIRLDIHYVENWSMTSDLAILWRTMRAVVGSEGAY